MIRTVSFALVATVTVGGLVVAAQERRGDDRFSSRQRFSATLKPSNEVPVVSSPAGGSFRATLDRNADTMDFELSFSGLQAPIVQAHIHMAQPNVNGGIVIWLCGTAAAPGPAGTATCPASGTVTGTIVPANVIAAATQGIAPGDFDEVIAAIKAGNAYVNVHSVQSPGGEIRGQLRRSDGSGHGNDHDDDDDHDGHGGHH